MKQVYPAGFVFWLVMFCCGLASGQNVLMDTGGTVTGCGGLFVDSGDTTGIHVPSGTRQVITLCADENSQGTHIQLDFTEIDFQGTLTIFNGTSTSADTLRQIDRSNVGDRLSLAATASNRSGCLTIEFVSTGTGNGWRADINCIIACQSIVADLGSSIPAAVPTVDGYIDVCVGEPITLTGKATFPENGAIYTQSEANSTFEWTFQNGDALSGKTVTYAYTEPGAYVAEVFVTDDRGCQNANRINQRIRVAPTPRFDKPDRDVPVICPGESITLLTGSDKSGPNAYQPSAQTISFSSTQTFSEQISIPDRQDEVYASSLDVQLFSPGQRISSGNDIAEICVTIEHSYLADLDMWIECPDGTRLTLLNKDDARGSTINYRFGYGEVDDTGPEEAETYCWTAAADESVYDYIKGNSGTGNTRPILPFDRSYLPRDNNFDGLTGCEMNGQWTLNVVDNFLEDDGTIYDWNITFSEDLVPSDESFTVPITESRWEDDGQFAFYSPDSVVYKPSNGGYANHRLTVVDDFGCSYDTLVRVDVASPFQTDCYTCAPPQNLPTRDTQVCGGQQLAVDLRDAFSFDTLVRWEAKPIMPLIRSDTSYLTISDHLPATFPGQPGSILPSVCLDIRADLPLSSVEVLLMAPGGNTIVIAPRGSLTTNRVNDCFSPGGSLNWEALQGEDVNGQWALIVNDNSGLLDGRLTSWSVDLLYQPPLAFAWSGGGSEFSCLDCPNPVISPTSDTIYTLTATSALGCQKSLDYRIELLAADVDFAPTIVDGCTGEANGSITLVPLTATPVREYQWSTGATTRDLTGLSAGTYELTVSTENGCTRIFSYDLTPPEQLSISVDTSISVSCFGESDGGISVSSTGGYGSYRYTWSEGVAGTSSSVTGLLSGNYAVTVTDSADCTATETVFVSSPDVLTLQLNPTDVSCRGGIDGQITPVVGGGTLPYSYRWSDGSTNSTLDEQPAGTYSVTVTDANGCVANAEGAVNQPEIPLSARVVNEVPGCFGTATNEATVLARGGNDDYRYSWSNGETGATAFGLPAGQNSVEVTDRSGCVYTFDFTTESRPDIEPTISLAEGDECRDVRERTLEARAPGSFYSYAWSTGANGSRITALEPETAYSVTLTDAEGCKGSESYTTDTHVPWLIDLETVPVTCFGQRDGSLRVLSASNRHGSSFTYEWGANTGFTEGPAVVDRPAGDYNLSVTDAIGCTLDTVLTVPGPELLRLEESLLPISCFGASDASLDITPMGGNGSYLFQWSTGATTSAINNLGPDTYSLTVTDAGGCTQEASYEIAAPEQITVDISSQGPVCGGEYNGRIDVTAAGGQSPLEFSLDDQRYSEASTFNGLGGGQYVVYVRDQVGCTIERDVDIEDGPAFSVDLGPDQEIVFGDSLALTSRVIGGRGDLDYAWSASYDSTLSCRDCVTPIARPEYEIDYRLSIVDGNGCTAEDMVRIRVRKIREVAVPTAFTPNGDGFNDRLLVHGRPGTTVLSFSVFDRWGGWLYTGQNFPVNAEDVGWDGLDPQGNKLDAGVYIFKVEVEYEDGSRELLSGQTTLIR
ncbi:proprotein convertase P-domain-containing protein [Lewinella sp. IMCC34191]|uniref:proprotein convertase P-domain-containing protein n=1 Tax=Lewinella sp. IMCC34191 TaxID=2259172 RepID=UPI0018E5A29B|nr:proprotein convertase P-domain-containing protein [Lewinella sp. IMCC34191]